MALAKPDIEKRLRTFIIENFFLDESQQSFADGQSLLESGIIDSTGILELVSFLESEYDIAVADEEMLPQNLDSISNLSTFILGKQTNSQ